MNISTYPADCAVCYAQTEHDIITDECVNCGTVLEVTIEVESDHPILAAIRKLPLRETSDFANLHYCRVCKEHVEETVYFKSESYIACVDCVSTGKIPPAERLDPTTLCGHCDDKVHKEKVKCYQTPGTLAAFTKALSKAEPDKPKPMSRSDFLESLPQVDVPDFKFFPHCGQCDGHIQNAQWWPLLTASGDVACSDCFAKGEIYWTEECDDGCWTQGRVKYRQTTMTNSQLADYLDKTNE